MFDFLRDLRKSEEEKRQETLSAYLDGALTPEEKKRFERLLASDETLRANLEEQRLIKASLRRLPRMRAPRNFTLDPARYGRPAPGPAERLYPIMRVATAAVAVLFVVALAIDLTVIGGQRRASQPLVEMIQPAAEIVEAPAEAEEAPVTESQAQQAAVGEAAVEVTRVVQEEDEIAEMAAEEPAAEEPAAEEAMEEAAEEVVANAAEAEAPLPGPEEAAGGGAPPGETPLAMVAPTTVEAEAAAAEGQAVEDRSVAQPPQPAEATAEAKASTAAAETALTQEAASQPAPSRAPQAVPSPGDELAAANQGPIQEAAGAGLPTAQLLTLGLGISLVVLFGVTLLLRRRAR